MHHRDDQWAIIDYHGLSKVYASKERNLDLTKTAEACHKPAARLAHGSLKYHGMSLEYH